MGANAVTEHARFAQSLGPSSKDQSRRLASGRNREHTMSRFEDTRVVNQVVENRSRALRSTRRPGLTASSGTLEHGPALVRSSCFSSF